MSITRSRLKSHLLCELPRVDDSIPSPVGTPGALIVNHSLTSGSAILTFSWMERLVDLLAEELCPVTESIFGRLYRSSPEGVAALIKTVPADTRAMLAVYCYRRAHLQNLGLAIAEACSAEDLQWSGGKMGTELLARAKAERLREDAHKPKLKSSKGISLASGRLWNPSPLED